MEKIAKLLEKAEAVFLTDPLSVRYFSGFRGEGELYLSGKRKVLITDSRYTEAAQKETGFDVVCEAGKKNRFAFLKEFIGADGVKSLGYEDAQMTVGQFSTMKKALGDDYSFVPLGTVPSDLRMIKTAEELQKTRIAAGIADEVFAKIREMIRPGMAEKDIAAEMEYRMKKKGADAVAFDTIVASGENSSMPHAVASEKKIEQNDIVTIDYGAKYDGYCSDATRTFFMGEASEEQKKVWGIVLQAQKTALSQIGPGKRGADLDAAARNVIKEAGYGRYFGHALGHGVGLFIHEEPRLSPASDFIMEPGMLVTVEPGIYLPGKFGVRIEDLVLITENGYENLTKAPKESPFV